MKYAVCLIFCFSFFVPSLSAQEQPVPDSIAATWVNVNRTDAPAIELVINKNGAVKGHVGEAVFVECIARRNRGWLGRLLNIKTDFIVEGGYLKGPISKQDTVNRKKFTIPFNIENDVLKGTVMRIYKWKYPDPLVHVRLQKKSKGLAPSP